MTGHTRIASTKPVQIVEGRRLEASPAQVWAIIGDFGNEHKWSSQLKLCTRDTDIVRVGTVRSCTLAKPLMGRDEAVEELIDYRPGATLAYRLRGSAGPFRSAEGTWSIRPDGSGTFVEVGGTFKPRNALIGILFGRLARAVAARAAQRALGDLADYIHSRQAAVH